jgi:hypothetical protein
MSDISFGADGSARQAFILFHTVPGLHGDALREAHNTLSAGFGGGEEKGCFPAIQGIAIDPGDRASRRRPPTQISSSGYSNQRHDCPAAAGLSFEGTTRGRQACTIARDTTNAPTSFACRGRGEAALSWEVSAMATYKGECFCGAVQVEASGEPEAMGYCHCRSCRSWSGGPVNAFTLWKPDAVRITAGAEHVGMFQKTALSQRQYLKFSPGVHINYAETVLPMRDGLPKLKDFPTEFGGSGEKIAE